MLSGLLLAICAPFLYVSASSFENSGVVRSIDLGGSLVHITTTYAAKALESGADVYTIALGKDEHSKTSWLEAKVKGQPKLLQITDHGPTDSRSFIIAG